MSLYSTYDNPYEETSQLDVEELGEVIREEIFALTKNGDIPEIDVSVKVTTSPAEIDVLITG